MLATLTLRTATVNSGARIESSANITAWPSQTVGSVIARPVADSSSQRPAPLPSARAGMRSRPVACPPRSSTASRCSTSTSHRWKTSSRPSHWRVSANSPKPSRTARARCRRARGGVGPGRSRVQQLRRREPGAVRRDVHAGHTTAIRRSEDTPVQLRAGFAELREAVASVAGGRDVETSPRCCGLRCTD